MKRTLLATAILVLLAPAAYAGARDHAYQIKPGLTAVVTVSGQDRPAVSARVGGVPQQLAVLDNEAVDVFETPDIDHDGYADLAIGQSGGARSPHAPVPVSPERGELPGDPPSRARDQPLPRLRQSRIRRRQARLLHGLPIQRRQPGTGKLRRAPRRHGRSRVLDHADLVPQASAKVEARYEFHGDGTVARILLDGEGSPFDGGDNVAPFDRRSLTRPTSRTAHRRSCARRAV